MKLSKLKKMKVLKLTNKHIEKFNKENGAGKERINIRTKRSNWVYKYDSAIIAAVEEGILKVAIFKREDIEAEKKTPAITLFIDIAMGEWISYEHKTDSWSKATIFKLLEKVTLSTSRAYGEYTYTDESTKRIVREYLNKDGSVKKAIYEWQRTKKNKIFATEMNQIDTFMETVPQLPKDFESWIWNTVYRNNATYIFMKPGKVTEGYCTYCKQMVELPAKKPRHNNTGRCKNCGTKVTFKGWNKQKNISKDLKVSIVQKCEEDEYVIRIFKTYEDYKSGKWTESPVRAMYEIYRYRLDRWFDVKEIFEYGEFRRTGIIRWCHEIPKGMGYWYGPSTNGIPYTRNLSRILKDSTITDAKYVPLADILKNAQNQTEIQLDKVLGKCNRFPGALEKLCKAKMFNLCEEILDTYNLPEEIYGKGRNLKEILDLPGEYVKQAIKMNADHIDIKMMQAAVMAKKNISVEQIKSLKEFYPRLEKNDLSLFLETGNITKTIRYLEKLNEEQEEQSKESIGRDYRDFLEQLDTLHIPANKKNKFPQNFYGTHAELAGIIAEKEDIAKKSETKKLNRKLKKRVAELEKLYKLESDEYEIVWPHSKKEFVVEGQLQHNCVGGYFEKMAEGKTVVFFLREKENFDKPFCTVEFREERCLQCRTAYNKGASEEAMKAMRQISKNYQKIKKEQAKKCDKCISLNKKEREEKDAGINNDRYI